jgi:hypothetical protein
VTFIRKRPATLFEPESSPAASLGEQSLALAGKSDINPETSGLKDLKTEQVSFIFITITMHKEIPKGH